MQHFVAKRQLAKKNLRRSCEIDSTLPAPAVANDVASWAWRVTNVFRALQLAVNFRAAPLGVITATVALATIFGTAAPNSASAFTCDSVTNPAGGNAGAIDNGDSENTACGKNAQANGGKATAVGNQAKALSSESVAVGNNASVDANSQYGIAVGRNADVQNAPGAIAIGRAAHAYDDYAVAVGESASATGDRSVALGKSAVADGDRSLALGTGATATHQNSSAIGVGATTTTDNQIVLGTADQTYQAPGLFSQLSKDRQSGPIEIVTSDAAGNLATDGGRLWSTIDQNSDDIEKNRDGAAIAIAMENPDLTGSERFGVAFNYGNFDGASAFSAAAMGVIWSDGNSRFAVSGGVGYGFETDTVGARVGGQFTW